MLCPLLLLLCTAGCSIRHAIRLEDGRRVGVDQMIAAVSSSPVVFIGENHDEPSHHALQLDVIRGMHQAGKPLAIGIEMFPIDSQSQLDAWIAGEIPEAQFIEVYQRNWRNLNWGLYRGIFLFARDNAIPMVALNVPQVIIDKVSHQGFSAMTSGDLRMIPPRSTAPLSQETIGFMTQYYPAHGKDTEAFRHLCEAQALRNRVMADAVARYLRRHPDFGMVVLTGGAHAWARGGIPSELGGLPYKVILPPFPGIAIDASGADYLLD